MDGIDVAAKIWIEKAAGHPEVPFAAARGDGIEVGIELMGTKRIGFDDRSGDIEVDPAGQVTQIRPLQIAVVLKRQVGPWQRVFEDRKSTRLNSSHVAISYAVFC